MILILTLLKTHFTANSYHRSAEVKLSLETLSEEIIFYHIWMIFSPKYEIFWKNLKTIGNIWYISKFSKKNHFHIRDSCRRTDKISVISGFRSIKQWSCRKKIKILNEYIFMYVLNENHFIIYSCSSYTKNNCVKRLKPSLSINRKL